MRALLLSPVLLALAAAPLAARNYDLVVYGATAGGVITAVSAAREGLKVALLEPGQHIGGMMTGGLSATDIGKSEVIGGYSLEFFARVAGEYQTKTEGEAVGWYFEPRVGEKIFHDMLREAGVQTLYGSRLREKTGVRKQGARVIEITTENGETYRGRIFADATYEGDLMAQAGVSYTWGREGVAQYGESLAGVAAHTPFHQFMVRVSAFDENGRLLPEIQDGPKGETGAADRKVQTYNFRMCLTDEAANQVPYPKPPDYNPGRYELLARLIEASLKANGRTPRFGEVASVIRTVKHKADINNNGAFSTDYIGKNWDYPEANYARRAAIWQDHVNYTKGFFYYLANDPRVPEELRKEANAWGLAKDEFTDTDHWPNQLYVREARRMLGEFVATQKDLQSERTKPDPIGMGSYNSDSHNVQRVATPDGAVENEGDVEVPVEPYQIPYRSIVPKRAEAENLLVPVCFSASHVAYSSMRMEPQYMIIGQAAGVAAKMAIRAKKPVQEIDTAALTARLRAQGVVLEYDAQSRARTLPIVRRMIGAKRR
ncbi:MAG TPA: FAD-dependent oxidoreductase [Bryobacteraceae bacterium]